VSGQLLRLQDEERRGIARDLHDSTGQNLVALATMLGQARRSIPSSERNRASSFPSVKHWRTACIREVRTLSYVLHPPGLDEAGLGHAIRDYVHGFTERSGHPRGIAAVTDSRADGTRRRVGCVISSGAREPHQYPAAFRKSPRQDTN